MGRIFKRAGRWYVDFTANGQRVRKSVSGDRQVALQVLKEMEGRAVRGEYGLADNRVETEELKRRYLKHIKLHFKKRTVEGYVQDLNLILSYLDSRLVSEINPSRIDDYVEHRKRCAPVSDRTINLEVMVLKSMLQKGVESELIASNPLQTVKPLKHRGKRFKRALTGEEIERLLDAATERYKPVWLCFITSGLRKSELVNLTWDDVDLKRKEIKVQNREDFETKTGGIRIIPMADRLYKELKALRPLSKSKYVFTTKHNTPLRNNLLTRFKETVKRAGIDLKGVRIHSLRHTFITHLIRNGANPKVVQQLAGHKSISITMDIYAEVLPGDERNAIMSVPSWHTGGTRKILKLQRNVQ
ncbi:MAG: site-specific integrase [Candidatus Brocadiales bacterium]|nr:site-specific integrase [Candidatus Bathyanammoxibius amoris]